jgi:para-aminobenzoate synthetase/4-amino-4-deoxychorismate lyase
MDIPVMQNTSGQEENLTFWMRDEKTDEFLVFQNPYRIFYVRQNQDGLLQALDSLPTFSSRTDQRARRTENLKYPYFAGAIAYDAFSDGFACSRPHTANSPAVLMGGLFDEPQRISSVELFSQYRGPMWPVRSMRLARPRRVIYDAIEAIREKIRAGVVYQANFTFSVLFSYDGDPAVLFANLYREQPAAFASALFYRNGEEHLALLSLSPELFFRVEGRIIHCRPMKGTAPVTGDVEADHRAAVFLRSSEKEKAENAMIVDLIRNDLGKICEFGSVEVNDLFHVEKLPTVFQMTTGVKGRLKKGLRHSDIFQALFPCGSVTGAPKRAAMELLYDIEGYGRGFYTGALGWSSAEMSCWSVAIRTAEIRNGKGTISIGSGITFDSDPRSEFRECMNKLAFFRRAVRGTMSQGHDLTDGRFENFYLYETILFRTRSKSYWLLQRHLKRLKRSAFYFGLPCSLERIARRLQRLARLLEKRVSTRLSIRVHLRLYRSGRLQIHLHKIVKSKQHVTLALHRVPALSILPYLNHKTSTGRAFYEVARSTQVDDYLYVNERGEVTETSIDSVFFLIDGRWMTPPLTSGLLAGVMRERLLETGRITEAPLTVDDAKRATAIIVANSVRGLRRAVLIEKG